MSSAAVLISIRPKWCELIANGQKTVEIRKTHPRLRPPFKCYIYETQGKKSVKWLDGTSVYRGVSKVIGEFVCDKIFRVDLENAANLSDAVDGSEVDLFLDAVCLSAYELLDYLSAGEKSPREYVTGYGWHIQSLKIYDQPKKLSEFYRWYEGGNDIRPCENGKPCKHLFYDYTEDCEACAIDFDGTDCPYLKVQRPPQNWCYVEEHT